MKALFQSLKTVNFSDYQNSLNAIRKEPNKGNISHEVSNTEFLYALRPYFWFLHNPGFQDILDTCEAAMLVLKDHVDDLMEETNPLMGNEFLSVATFLVAYIEEGNIDASGWKMLFASPEIATSVTAEKYIVKLKEKGVEANKIQAIENLASCMKAIESSKHTSYWILRDFGNQYCEVLQSIIHSFPSDNQSFILHALDGFIGDKNVISFYQNYILNCKSEDLREEAEKYLSRIVEN